MKIDWVFIAHFDRLGRGLLYDWYSSCVGFIVSNFFQVHELCDNFCQRYITCLKGKMPTDLITEERAGSSASSTSESHANTSGSSGHMGGNPQGSSSSRMPDAMYSHHPPSGPSPGSPHTAVGGNHGGPTSAGSVYDSAPPSAGSSCERQSTEPAGTELSVSR